MPVSEQAATEILSPIYPGITVDQQERVADVLPAAGAGRVAWTGSTRNLPMP
jgi:hypothetical protein